MRQPNRLILTALNLMGSHLRAQQGLQIVIIPPPLNYANLPVQQFGRVQLLIHQRLRYQHLLRSLLLLTRLVLVGIQSGLLLVYFIYIDPLLQGDRHLKFLLLIRTDLQHILFIPIFPDLHPPLHLELGIQELLLAILYPRYSQLPNLGSPSILSLSVSHLQMVKVR